MFSKPASSDGSAVEVPPAPGRWTRRSGVIEGGKRKKKTMNDTDSGSGESVIRWKTALRGEASKAPAVSGDGGPMTASYEGMVKPPLIELKDWRLGATCPVWGRHEDFDWDDDGPDCDDLVISSSTRSVIPITMGAASAISGSALGAEPWATSHTSRPISGSGVIWLSDSAKTA